ncbi:hypothetical protein [Gemmata sp.]|uniref:hypothetical protein n=1 Tax=Gemmata sp. TaxID=1914242 RepID=UPI003F7010E4
MRTHDDGPAGSALAPLIARAIELGRGPAALLDWLGGRAAVPVCRRAAVDRLARELAALLREGRAVRPLDAETLIAFARETWRGTGRGSAAGTGTTA